jgi:hypothetical protein
VESGLRKAGHVMVGETGQMKDFHGVIFVLSAISSSIDQCTGWSCSSRISNESITRGTGK